MFGTRSILVTVGACAAMAMPPLAAAAPLSYVTLVGYANAQAADGLRTDDRYTAQNTSFGSPNDQLPSAATGRADASAHGNVTSLIGSPGLDQGATASAIGSAGFGSLHGSATAGTSTTRYQYRTIASATSTSEWVDTITFHTRDPDGADYHYALSLNDALGTTIVPFADPSYLGGLVTTKAYTALSVIPTTGQTDFLAINDSRRQFPSLNGTDPGPIEASPPASRTLDGVIHVFDGDVVSFEQFFLVTAESDNLDAMASAIADDTAYFNLFSLDAGSSYTSASGTLYATAGDPDAGPVVGPPTGGTVPEPSELALLVCGVVALLIGGRQSVSARRLVVDRLARLCIAAGVLCATTAMATPLSYVTNYENTYTQAANGPVSGNGYTSDDQRVGAEYDVYATPGHVQAVASNSSGTLTHGVGGIATDSTSTAAASGRADFGALHGSARATTTVGDVYEQNTTSFARTASSWYDTLTFRTGAGGADYQYSITLADTLAATAVSNQVNADAGVSLFVQGGLPLQLYRSTFDGDAGTHATTLTGFLHVENGQMVSFFEQFEADAFADFFTAAASTVADDTAYFDLFTLDPDASYAADSGTTYATSGDPDLVAPPPRVVPEPPNLALLLAGVGAFVWERRRMARRESPVVA